MRERSLKRKVQVVDRQKILVVKFGTAMLMRDGAMRQDVFRDFARQVHELTNLSMDFVVLVTNVGNSESGEQFVCGVLGTAAV